MVARAVARDGLWQPGDALVVAVSGGADSLCLLGALLDLRERRDASAPGELIVATLDHGLRGAAGSGDARWVAEFAESLGLRSVSGQVNTRTLARQRHLSIEQAARRLRYRFLRDVARETGAARICVAHTQDDQAETVLLHLLRGSGLTGLTGMRALSGDIARPLLAVSHAQIEAFCAARGWEPRFDETNLDEWYMRNRVRSSLLPALEAYNPRVREALARLAAHLAEDESLLSSVCDDAWAVVMISETPEGTALRLSALRALHPALRGRLIKRAASRFARAIDTDDDEIADTPSLETRHINLIQRLIAEGETGARLTLPDGLRVTRDYDALRFNRDNDPKGAHARSGAPKDEARSREWALKAPGSVVAKELGWRVRAVVTGSPPGLEMEGALLPPQPELLPVSHAGTQAAMRRGEWRVYADAEATAGHFTVRSWRPGDRFRPLGMARAKKLQDVFADAKVPREIRKRLPLVCSGSHIVWVAGVRLGDEFKLTDTTTRILILQAEPLDESLLNIEGAHLEETPANDRTPAGNSGTRG
jgi:tRNA(Ile)-lysidine synthase